MAGTSPQSKRWLLTLALVAWAIATIAISVRVGLHPRSHSTFGAYLDAGRDWLHRAPVYAHPGPGFVYSPLVAAFIAPMGLLPDGAAEIVWRVLIALLVVGAIVFASRQLWKVSTTQTGLLLLLALPLTLNNLNNGQANLLLEGLLLFAAASVVPARWLTCALCGALAAFVKIYPLAVGLLLVLLFPRALWWRLALCLVGLFLFSLVLQSPAYAFGEYQNWLAHLAGDKRREINYYGMWRDFYLLVRIAGIPISAHGWIVLQLAAAATAGVIVLLANRARARREDLSFLALSLGLVWMLLFGPATEAATYVLISFPAAYLVLRAWTGRAQPAFRAIASVVFLGLLLSDYINSILRPRENIHLVHAIQPALTLIFCLALYSWWRGPREARDFAG